MFREGIIQVKDYIFPVFCLECGKEGAWVCDVCFQQIDISGVFLCPVCHTYRGGGVCCLGCEAQSFLFSHVAVAQYVEYGLIGKIIKALKYEYAEDVANVIGCILNTCISGCKPCFLGIDMVIPVPLHKKRFAERGFNQSNVIARYISVALSLSQCDALERKKPTLQQAKLDKEERKHNVQDAFVVVDTHIGGKQVLLVDDIYTTGATMQECARVLLESGAQKVFGFSLARG